MDSTQNGSKRPTKFESSTSEEKDNEDEGTFHFKGPSNEKRMKKDDSGINVIAESDTSDDGSDCANISIGKASKYPKVKDDQSTPNSPDSGNLELNPAEYELDQKLVDFEKSKGKSNLVPKVDEVGKDEDLHDKNKLDSDGDSDEDDKMECDKSKDDDKTKYDPTPSNPRPIHKWSAPISVLKRQYGFPVTYSPHLFRYNCNGSLHMVERLELMYKMKKHDGCVNTLNFNTDGTRLVTGSDDLDIILWDWTVSEPLLDYPSGHRSNVFQAKFMPLSGDLHIVSCARDGQVRLGELSSTGAFHNTRKLAQHKGAAHKLAIQMDSPHTFLSCGEDAVVFELDLRKEKPEKLTMCKENTKKIALYSIFINPYKTFEYVIGGRDQYVRVYDSRFVNQEEGCLKKYCPQHLVGTDSKANVTSVVYSYNGQEILASYNDEDIYTFDSNESDISKFLHRFKGHRNSQTVKGVNYFGSKSEFVVSGSDCGYIFFWEKESEHIVKYMYGDQGGVVNCLEPNPNLPVLATSGLDDDIKIWVPSCEEPPDLAELRKHIISNMKDRDDDSNQDCSETFVDHTIWFLMQHLARRRRQPELDSASSNSASSDSEPEDSSELHSIQCNQS